jgi:arylsulfatase A-like enzyme
LFLHYQCTHEPYVKHGAWDFGDSDVDKYDSALAYCDDEIGRLLGAIDRSEERERTAVILYSDHGELFGEHGYVGHGNTLYEEDVRVLLLARIPGATASTVDTPASLTDIAPTIAALAGAELARSGDAWNLVPLAFSREIAADRERPLFLYADMRRGLLHYDAHAVVRGDHKLIGLPGTTRLFRLELDPHEEANVAADAIPEEGVELAQLLHAWTADVKRSGDGDRDREETVAR